MPAGSSDYIIAVISGIALAACFGFRIFVPLLVATLGLRFNFIPEAYVQQSVVGLARNDLFLLALSIATILEILAYKIPYVDNFFDAIATPLAVVAATLLSSSFFNFADDFYLRFILGAITGGVGAGIIQTSTSLLRLGSTKFTGGLGNPIFGLIESAVAFFGSLLALLLPLVGIIFIILCCWGFILLFKKLYKINEGP